MSSLKILSTARKRSFDNVPKLSKQERIGYLTLDTKARKFVGSLKTIENKVGFILQRAYFQAKGRFFEPMLFRPRDKRTAEKSLGVKDSCDLTKYATKNISHHKKMILKSYKWRPFLNSDKAALNAHALLHVDKQSSSEDTLFALLDFCWKNKTEIPTYNQLSEIVSKAFISYEEQTLKVVKNCITQEQQQALLDLINNPEITGKFSDIKKIDQSEGQRKLNKNAEILELFKDTFLTIKPLLDKLNLTPQAIKHFSDWIYKSNISQIKRLNSKTEQCLRLAAFVQDQFFLRQDYSVDAILKLMRGTTNKAKSYERSEKDKIANKNQESNQSVLDSAKNSHQILKLIIEISNNQTFTYSERNQKVLHLAESFFEAENPNLVSHFQRMEININNNKLKLNYHQYLFSRSESLQKSLSPFIRVLMFDEMNSNKFLIMAIKDFSNNYTKINEDIAKGFMTKEDLQLVFSKGEIPQISRYKIILFAYIEKAIRNRSLTMKYSYRYRDNRSYLIQDAQWENNRTELLAAARLTDYENGEDVLKTMGSALTETYRSVNKRYLADENNFLKVDEHGNWRVKKSEADFDSSKYIPGLLKNSKFKLLYELLSEIDSYTNFSDKFKHYLNKQSNKSIEKKLIYATLMSLGTNLGHNNMSKATNGISNKNLIDTDRLWFSNENIEKANQCIVEFIQSLPLPTIFNDKDGLIHTSNDGKKLVVAVNSLLANYSYKYYGKEQGINVNSFLDEKQAFFHVNVLTSSDREAPYMMDGIVNTKASLFREGQKEHLHSSDTHGYTEAIFAGLHFLDVSFAPRIAKLHKQTIYAYEAKSLRKNSKLPIGPNTVINKKLILNNWDDILRLMATIKLGYCSASQIFKILSSSKVDNELYKAIKEFGRLIKSKFILNYIDNESLRKSIQKQLNRVELGQKLSEAIFFARKGRLHVGTSVEMQQAMACKTLLKNAIILWNYLYLSDFYNNISNKEEKKFVLESISNGSVISWRHINMHGSYDFDKEFERSFRSTMHEMKNIKIYL